ncbi:MAG: PH domain-containing protein [Tannerellaceae bacterium]|nr:PH domain-containing protein [Tannerellaceae bacterium]
MQPSVLPVSSYALSLNRLIIWKDGKMWMLISSQNRKEFVNLLLKYNPDITLKQQSFL